MAKGYRTGNGIGRVLLSISLLLGVVSLFLEQAEPVSAILRTIYFLDYAILFFVLLELVFDYRRSLFKKEYLRRNVFSLLLVLAYVVLFVYNRVVFPAADGGTLSGVSSSVVIIRNVFLLLKVFARFRRLSAFLDDITSKPAQTILISFLLAILVGTLLLMMPFTAADSDGLSFIDALFTSTSAVCVTGLIVVDTSTAFSTWGHVVIMVLIQIGGLGIMILSFFAIFIIRRSFSVEDKFLISYMLSENDMSGLTRSVMRIVMITFGIEAVCSILLFLGFGRTMGWGGETAFSAVFHSVSAFCNAGFSLFPDSLERFRNDLPVNLIVAFLIIAGGISFSVIVNVWNSVKVRLVNRFTGGQGKVPRLSLNSVLVLSMTAGLLILSMFLVYAFEHDNTYSGYTLGEQYLASFFQAVTLRTAGFNTIPFASLTVPMYLVMTVFMFIGAASGSTAGGIKINTVGVLGSYVSSVLRNRSRPMLGLNSIPSEQILKAFLILLFGISVVTAGTLLLTITERAPLEHIAFEAVSAFGTVGLSAGLTPDLTVPGKGVIIALMFMGRLGPLTVITAASLSKSGRNVQYPQANIMIG